MNRKRSVLGMASLSRWPREGLKSVLYILMIVIGIGAAVLLAMR